MKWRIAPILMLTLGCVGLLVAELGGAAGAHGAKLPRATLMPRSAPSRAATATVEPVERGALVEPPPSPDSDPPEGPASIEPSDWRAVPEIAS
ncbi:MAG: hypothetical protein OEY14_06150, partial [Myxococcales bacterium]|nr:hypothetical protein [Myxococcales bacterium]